MGTFIDKQISRSLVCELVRNTVSLLVTIPDVLSTIKHNHVHGDGLKASEAHFVSETVKVYEKKTKFENFYQRDRNDHRI